MLQQRREWSKEEHWKENKERPSQSRDRYLQSGSDFWDICLVSSLYIWQTEPYVLQADETVLRMILNAPAALM